MLEILSHKSLKNFLKSNYIDWKHIYSFGRIISQSIQTNHNYLINSEIFLTDKWYSALLISLFLNEENAFLVMSKEEIDFLIKNQLTLLKEFGFDFVINNNELIFSKHKIFLLTLDELFRRFNNSSFNNQRIVLKDIQTIKADLKKIFKISLYKRDWFEFNQKSDFKSQSIEDKYHELKQEFFSRAISHKKLVHLEMNDIKILKEFFLANSFASQKFYHVNHALISNWACWVELDYENFEWILIFEPIDEIVEIKDLLSSNNFIFLSAFRRDNFFQKYLKNHNISIDLNINFKSDFIEKNFLIYVPQRQMLPNNPLFLELIIKQCIQLFLFRKEFTVILSNSHDLKMNLATQLASIYGNEVSLETFPKNRNSILVASYDWWIENQFGIQSPNQIIIPLLPIPDITDPINEKTISYHFQNSKDWFRDFLLPEAINILDKTVLKLRKNSGSLIILDGRSSNKQWGRELLNKIQPSKVVKHRFYF